MNIKITTLGLAGLLLATACSNDEVKLARAANEISFNTCVSRATVTTTDNLASFKVWANASGFDNQIINGKVATKPAGKDYFTLTEAVLWPQDVAQLDVYALAPSDLTATFNSNGPTISGFEPDTDPAKQKDLIVAYKEAMRSDGTSIDLIFHHALSQIEVKAIKAAEGGSSDVKETKHVMIKGAWIVNVVGKGTLAFTKDATNYMSWSADGGKTQYGLEYSSVQTLDHESSSLLASGLNSSNLLLVPQQLATWDLNSSTDKPANSGKGAYILVLCRVEAEHDGTTHVGDDAISVDETNNKHKHQLFPYTGKFDAEEYGYSCVPINTNWEPGKKYVYNLSFCGVSSGAGVYPPSSDLANFPDGNGKYIKFGTAAHGFPEKKGIGDPVLDSPITFTVQVDKWATDDPSSNVPMN